MSNQLKTRIQAMDAVTNYRRWVELEVSGEGIAVTILKEGEEFKTITKVWVPRDQFIRFIVGYLVSGMGAYDKTIKDLVLSIAKQIIEKLEEKERTQ